MAKTTKTMSTSDYQQVLKRAYNEDSGGLCTEGWITGKIGRRISYGLLTTSVADDTVVNTYIEDGVTLMVLHSVYTDATHATILYVTRVS